MFDGDAASSYSFMTAAWRVGETTLPGTPVTLSFARQGCWGAKVAKIKNSSKRVLAIEVGWPWAAIEENIVFLQGLDIAHDPKRPLMNVAFVDGHVRFLELQKHPYHYNNSEYDLCEP
jgi:prepilin-type processing-associated H-X9-DG protein